MTLVNSERSGQPSTDRIYHLISADSHVNEPPTLWVDRVPTALRDRVPRMEHFDEGDAWIVEGVNGPMPLGLNACAGQEPRLRQAWVHFEDIRAGGYNPAARVIEIDRAGIDAEVLYPTPRLAMAIYATTDPVLHIALVRAYNDWIAEYADYDLQRFRALPIVPNRGQEGALAEIDRVGDRPSTGGFLMGAYPGGTLEPQPDDDAVIARIAERGVPLNIHVSLSLNMPFIMSPTALPAGNGAGRVTAASDQLTNLIFSGVFDRIPDLKVVFAEVDCGWVPYIKEQMDDGFQRYRFRFNLRHLPSEYIEQHAHFTYVSDTYGIDNRYRIGVDRILWSSDYPHGNSNYPDAWSPLQASLAGVPHAERALIMAGNAIRLYGFGRRP
ncbi:MAG TPA: amidohydrolase family protein [Acidimicrobiales bacterium]|nr:amidohydrolase family protein [Acidimicrobiales bacterium]